MIEVEKAKRLFLSHMVKTEPEIMQFVGIISDEIESEAAKGSPMLIVEKSHFENCEPLTDMVMLYLATYFKAKGYNIRLLIDEIKDDDIHGINIIYISWVDVFSMFDSKTLRKSVKISK